MSKTVHPDISAGALAALKEIADESTFEDVCLLGESINRYRWSPDPHLRGVWGFFRHDDDFVEPMRKPKCILIVYLAGYDGRVMNDFEMGD
jgi:hypothetical protein